MAAVPSDLTTLADYKTAQNISGTSDDAWIQQLITRTTGWIEQQINRKLVARYYNGSSGTHALTAVPSEDYLYFDGDWNQRDRFGYGLYYLPQYPVQPNATLAFKLSVLQSRDNVNTTGDVWNATQYLEGRDYVVDRTYGSIRLLSGPFEQGMKNFRVKYAAGYGQTTGAVTAAPWVPTELQQLCIDMANLIYRDKRNLKSENVGIWGREWDLDREDPWIANVLGAYTRYIL